MSAYACLSVCPNCLCDCFSVCLCLQVSGCLSVSVCLCLSVCLPPSLSLSLSFSLFLSLSLPSRSFQVNFPRPPNKNQHPNSVCRVQSLAQLPIFAQTCFVTTRPPLPHVTSWWLPGAPRVATKRYIILSATSQRQGSGIFSDQGGLHLSEEEGVGSMWLGFQGVWKAAPELTR